MQKMKLLSPQNSIPRSVNLSETSDVSAERIRVDSIYNKIKFSNINEATIVLKNLNKKYCKKEVVRDLSLAITQNECFGLLGPNGSGKTTTIKMMEGNK